MTSYQRIKLENRKLKTDIYVLVMRNNTFEGISTRLSYEIIFKSNDAIMKGDVNKKPKLKGLYK